MSLAENQAKNLCTRRGEEQVARKFGISRSALARLEGQPSIRRTLFRSVNAQQTSTKDRMV